MWNTPQYPYDKFSDPLVDPRLIPYLETKPDDRKILQNTFLKEEILNILPSPLTLTEPEIFPPILEYPDPFSKLTKPSYDPIIPLHLDDSLNPDLDFSLFEWKAMSLEDWQAILDRMDFDKVLARFQKWKK